MTTERTLNIGDRVESVTDFMYGYDQLQVIAFDADAVCGSHKFDYLVNDMLNNIAYGFNEGELILADSEVQL